MTYIERSMLNKIALDAVNLLMKVRKVLFPGPSINTDNNLCKLMHQKLKFTL